jgi:hypothetical protein
MATIKVRRQANGSIRCTAIVPLYGDRAPARKRSQARS